MNLIFLCLKSKSEYIVSSYMNRLVRIKKPSVREEGICCAGMGIYYTQIKMEI